MCVCVCACVRACVRACVCVMPSVNCFGGTVLSVSRILYLGLYIYIYVSVQGVDEHMINVRCYYYYLY